MRSGNPSGDGPGGIFTLDHETFEVKGAWEKDRGPQQLSYDFWWHLGQDTMITSEWGTPNMVKDGVNPELLLGGKYGMRSTSGTSRSRTHLQRIDLGAEQQMALELRPSHNPRKTLRVCRRCHQPREPLELDLPVVSRHGDRSVGREEVIEIPAEPRTRRTCPTCSRDSRRCRRW